MFEFQNTGSPDVTEKKRTIFQILTGRRRQDVRRALVPAEHELGYTPGGPRLCPCNSLSGAETVSTSAETGGPSSTRVLSTVQRGSSTHERTGIQQNPTIDVSSGMQQSWTIDGSIAVSATDQGSSIGKGGANEVQPCWVVLVEEHELFGVEEKRKQLNDRRLHLLEACSEVMQRGVETHRIRTDREGNLRSLCPCL